MDACVLSHSVVADSLWPYGPQSTRLLCSWDSPGKNDGIGSFSRSSSQPRDQTLDSLAGGFFTTESPENSMHTVCVCMCVRVCVCVCVCARIASHKYMGFPGSTSGKEPTFQCRRHKKRGSSHWIWVGSMGWEDPLEEATKTHFQILAWKIPEEPGRLQSIGSQRVRHD